MSINYLATDDRRPLKVHRNGKGMLNCVESDLVPENAFILSVNSPKKHSPQSWTMADHEAQEVLSSECRPWHSFHNQGKIFVSLFC